MMTETQGEIVSARPTLIDYQDLAQGLKQAHEIIMDMINAVHLMSGPARLEMAETTVEVRQASGMDFPVPAGFFIGDIESACKVLKERLKG